MSDPETITLAEAHKKFAVSLNNQVWDWLAKPGRRPEEDEQMVHAAHASCYHWIQAGGPEHRVRADWLLARVYAVLKRPESALRYARLSLEGCERHGFKDFDLAYCYEGMARAFAASGHPGECARYYRLAKEAGEQIAEEEDRKIFDADLAAEPWFGAI